MHAAFPVLFALGSVALALWADERAGARRPESITRRMIHALVAVVAFYVASGAIVRYAPDSDASVRMTLLFAVFLPACVYVFVTAAWLVRTLADVAQLRR